VNPTFYVLLIAAALFAGIGAGLYIAMALIGAGVGA